MSSTKVSSYETPTEQHNIKSRGIVTGCICTPILMACGIFCCLIVITIVILAVILAVNVNACSNLSKSVDINTITPSVYTYDPNAFPTFNFNSFNNILTKTGQIYVTQSNSTSDTNITVSVRIAATRDESITVKEENDDSTKKIFIQRADTFKGSLAWIGYLSLPPRCILAKVEVVLPQTIPSTTSIDTDVNDIVFDANSVPYSQMNAKTINGDINVNNFAVGNLTLNTYNGGITGSVSGIINQLIATTNNGKIQLNVLVNFNATNPNIETTNSNGDIQLSFSSSFNGNYDAKTDLGKVTIINASPETNEDKRKAGKVGNNGNGSLITTTKSGNINITF
ncbi:hypothetical protein C1645_766341 [Glomus cerebriforme]|uniref:DUF4097 domain-containing protein n=1 Tax=Glomus cerebriforme TaxID=658196 RepID=A0A397T0T3_9GLOM|nr:hypothetical protein C1645_766341 [Glomus cerebriforme]